MRALVLHIGLHKTATTSLQGFLAEQRGLLARKGVHFFPLQQMRKEISPLIQTAAQWERKQLVSLLAGFPAPAILLSDENIIGHAGEIPLNALYRFAAQRVGGLVATIPNVAVDIVLTLRNPADFLASMYCEHLRHAPFVTAEEYFAAFDVAGFAFRDLFAWLHGLPANARVHIVPFEAERGGGLPVIADTILAAACGPGHGIDLGKLPTTRSRASFKQEEIDLFTDVAERAGREVATALVKAVDSRGLSFGTRKLQPFPSDVVDRLAAAYLADLEHFREAFAVGGSRERRHGTA